MLEPLPIDAALDDIRVALQRCRAVVVVAEPGAGKTTRVPPALLDSGAAIVLQPRRAAARAIARRIASERAWTVGREVGWHVRFERNFCPHTRLVIATEGVLTARLQQDPLLSEFRTIILDEFHERSIHADVAIALARQAMQARDDLRLVVMSATMDAGRVSAFLGGCPIVQVPGQLHPVRIVYGPGLGIGAAIARTLRETAGNVLCFQPGAFEIRRTIKEIDGRLGVDIDALPLHGSLAPEEQDRVLSPAPGRRHVIVCTNIAETSVTVPGITAVVDAGLEKVARYDNERAIDSLMTERIAQAAADQRAGRAGRTGPGLVYRLWSAQDRLRPFREPEIHRIDLSGVVLDILAWGGDPRTLNWFDPPRPEGIASALTLLERMGAVRGLALTEVGHRMQRIPLPPRLARIVVAGNGDRRVVRAVAMLAERQFLPSQSASTSSDLLSALDRWGEVPERTRQVARQVERSARQDTRLAESSMNESEFRRAILAGYPDRVGQRREPRSNRVLLATGTGAQISPASAVRDAEYIVALDLQASNRPEDTESRIRMASAVDREWLTPTSTEVEYVVDERGFVKAREVDRYDALRVSERPITPAPERAAKLLVTEWRARATSEADQQLLRRLRFAGCEIDLPALLTSAAYGARSLDDIDLAAVLPRDLLHMLERNAPDTMPVPSGRRARLEYAEDGTVSASVKLQELFGLAETPRLGPRREPILLVLLAPNGRPVQMTRDLKSFWERTYQEVRKELRGRYPKHPWPEDPWSAVATHRTKARA